MYTLITILTIFTSVLLMAVVLIQNPKGGSLSPAFSSAGNQLLGARRSSGLAEKLTWGLGLAIIVLCLSTAFFV